MRQLTTIIDDDGVVYKTFQAFFKTPYNHDTDAESARVAQVNLEPTKTQQHLADETDINTIVKNFGITGKLPVVQVPPTYQQWDQVFDFQSAMNLVNQARDSFMQLPAETRNAFGNDPNNFVNQVDRILGEPDEAKREEGLSILRAMNLAVTPGPIADKTTLGDVLKAIKEQGTPKPPPVG